MALRTILTKEDPVLRKKSRPVVDFDARTWALLDDLTETLKKANGLGLASPQVGMLRRAVVILKDNEYTELLNPMILSQEGEINSVEACLSCPDMVGFVKRPQKVKVRAQDRQGKFFEFEAEDMLARAVCHELDHLDGVLYIDKATNVMNDDEYEQFLQELEAEQDDDANEIKKEETEN